MPIGKDSGDPSLLAKTLDVSGDASGISDLTAVDKNGVVTLILSLDSNAVAPGVAEATDKLRGVFTPEMFFAGEPGYVDSEDWTDAISAALDAAQAFGADHGGGGTVRFGPNDYFIRSPITQTGPAHIEGTGFGGVGAAATPAATGSNIIARKKMGYLWRVISAQVGQRVYNSAFRHLHFNGNFRAKKGIWLSSTMNAIIDNVLGSKNTEHGLFIDDANEVLNSHGRINAYRYTATENILAKDSVGIEFESIGAAIGNGITNWHCDELYLDPGINDAPSMIVGDMDSSYFARVQAIHNHRNEEGRQGRIILRGDRRPEIDLRACRKNTFTHLGAPIEAEAGAIVTILSANSEPIPYIDQADGAVVHYSIIDRNDGAFYSTSHFTMGRPLMLGPLEVNKHHPDTAPVVNASSQHVPTYVLAHGSTKVVSWLAMPPADFDDGSFTEIKLHYIATSGGNIPLNVGLRTTSRGQGFGADEVSIEIDVPAKAQGSSAYQTAQFPMDQSFTRGDITTLTLSRIKGGANSGNLSIIAAELFFKAEGPTEGIGQRYACPDLKTTDRI